MTTVQPNLVLSVVEARSQLGSLIKTLKSESGTTILIGSHRKPEAVLSSIVPEKMQNPTKLRLAAIDRSSKVIKLLAPKFSILRIGLFGSVSTGKARPNSDIDFAVMPAPNGSLGLIAEFEEILCELLGFDVHLTLLRDSSEFSNLIESEIQWLN